MGKINKDTGFFAEFKKFISRGNVVDMAVGIVVGAAFTAIVQSFANDLILPVVSLLTGGVDFTDMNIMLRAATDTKPGLFLSYGKFIQTVVNFLIISFCVFLFVRSVNKLREAGKSKEIEEKRKADELAAQAAATAAAVVKVDEKLETLKSIEKLLEKQLSESRKGQA